MNNFFEHHIKKNFPFLLREKFVLAISGGIDSVALAYLCHQMKMNFELAHCNFNLRGQESDDDEAFIEQLGSNLSIPVHVKKFETLQYAKEYKMSVQMAARSLRYSWFNDLAEGNKFKYIVTAHHADDNFETFLINLFRGTGLDGLLGIPEVNDNIVRPLLPFKREAIEKFAENFNLQWREDSSNTSTKYVRNKIRQEVLPILKKINPQLLENFERTQTYLKQTKSIVDDRLNDVSHTVIQQKGNDKLIFDIVALQKLDNTSAYLYELLHDYGFTQWDAILNLLTAQSGKYVYSNSHRLIKNRNFLILQKIKESINPPILITQSEKCISTPFGSIEINRNVRLSKVVKSVAYLDESTLTYPLTLRAWQQGDFFYPYGMVGKKKISKFLKDEKLSLSDKEEVWLLCANDNDIVWVLNHRIDKRFAACSSTKKIIKFEIK